jgi:hypothetical protein
MSKIFGGSKSKSKSVQKSQSASENIAYNKAYEPVTQAFSPLLGEVQRGLTEYNAFMGGDTTGFDAYKEATGYDLAESEGLERIMGDSAARGIFQSGATGKALQKYGTGLQQQFAGNYLDRLLGRIGVGQKAGDSIIGAGGFSSGKSNSFSEGMSNSTSKSKPGLGSFIGQAASAIAASDRRLKKNISKIGEYSNGLGIYKFHYINESGPFIGVMADEVARIQPDALGPVIDGYMTVDYSKIDKGVV